MREAGRRRQGTFLCLKRAEVIRSGMENAVARLQCVIWNELDRKDP